MEAFEEILTLHRLKIPVKGYASIPDVIRNIEMEEENNEATRKKAA